MKKNIFFLFCLFSISASAQNSGYRGARWMIKTDLLQPAFLRNGFTIENEIVILRNIAVTIEYAQGDRKGHFDGDNFGSYDDKTRWNVRQRSIELGVKLYTSGAFTAPRGMYVTFRYGFGSASGNGIYYYSITNSAYDGEYRSFSFKNMPIRGGRFGLGWQFIISRYIVADISGCITFSNMNKSLLAQDEYAHFREMRHIYGYNFGSISGYNREENLTWGAALHAKVGFLIPSFKKIAKPNYVF